MTESEIRALTRRQLVATAKEKQVKNYGRLTKDQLVDALIAVEAGVPPAAKKAARPEAAAVNIPTAALRKEPPGGWQERVEETKYYTGPVEKRWEEMPTEIPVSYGDNRIVVLVRDPWWLHAYWEVSPQQVTRGKQALGLSEPVKTVLRVYDVTGCDFTGNNANASFDIELTGMASNWYIHVGQPNASYCVDIGLVSPQGQFYTLARSNAVTTPRDKMSDVVDEKWMSTKGQAEKMYALSGGFRVGAGSLELRQLMEERLKQEISSGAWSGAISSWGSGAVPKRQQRGFWFVLDAELIVYGATDPSAKVTLQGKPVNLRPDGTFTARFALPDGEQVIPVTATSPDAVETRTITPIVNRMTK